MRTAHASGAPTRKGAALLERFKIAKAAVSDPWLERDPALPPRQFTELDPPEPEPAAELVEPPSEGVL